MFCTLFLLALFGCPTPLHTLSWNAMREAPSGFITSQREDRHIINDFHTHTRQLPDSMNTWFLFPAKSDQKIRSDQPLSKIPPLSPLLLPKAEQSRGNIKSSTTQRKGMTMPEICYRESIERKG
ncbi:hypothetical protein B0H63DRAFT_71768 [Podospora didyma]|uniref:Secreted protein n=1 Tax=Podospora didyma TaxID=330526 RepID=A0AAE0K2H1_9PEZI|nr:hypothetical protein B0H63DRAFT_71768 [Podospora didyma]